MSNVEVHVGWCITLCTNIVLPQLHFDHAGLMILWICKDDKVYDYHKEVPDTSFRFVQELICKSKKLTMDQPPV